MTTANHYGTEYWAIYFCDANIFFSSSKKAPREKLLANKQSNKQKRKQASSQVVAEPTPQVSYGSPGAFTSFPLPTKNE